MAFGLSPKYEFDSTFNELSSEEILVISLNAAQQLGWNVNPASRKGFQAYTGMSFSSYGEEVSVIISDHGLSLKSQCTGAQLVDWGRNKKNVERFLEAFGQARSGMTPALLAERLAQLENQWMVDESAVVSAPRQKQDRGFWGLFVPSEGFVVTPVILYLNILVFVLMVLGGASILMPDTQILIDWGANFRPMTLDGEPWRLLTCCFIHIGILHLLMNMYALIYISLLLEPQLGSFRFGAAYLLAGIGGSTLSLYWHDLTVSAGASGAIFGLYGVFLAMLTTNLIERNARRQLLVSIGIFVSYNLMNGMKGGIDNAAHIGGLISGLLFGYASYFSLSRPSGKRLAYLTLGIPTVLVLFTATLIYRQTPNDLAMYDKKMETFIGLEKIAMEVYHLDGTTSNERMMEAIQEQGITNWQQAIIVVRDADQLNIPESLHERNQKLIEYCELRIKSYELLYKAVEEESDDYQAQIQECNEKIGQLIEELGGGK